MLSLDQPSDTSMILLYSFPITLYDKFMCVDLYKTIYFLGQSCQCF